MNKQQVEYAIKLLMPIYQKHLDGEMTLDDIQVLYDHAHMLGYDISANSRQMLALHKEYAQLLLTPRDLE